MMNRFVTKGTVSKFWFTEISLGQLHGRSRIFCSKDTDRNFRNLCIERMGNIRGLNVSMHCSMASGVIKSFLPFLFFQYQFKYAFELPDFSIVAAKEVNGSVQTA